MQAEIVRCKLLAIMSDVGANGEGERVVRASRRADGTYRKERKIRDGYVPPDEQVAYVSRGKQVRMLQTSRSMLDPDFCLRL